MTRDPRLYLHDILDSIEKIQRYTSNMSFQEFTESSLTIDAVVRNFEIIEEASGRIPDDIQYKYPEIPWYEMKSMRNIVAHEYFRVDLKIIWKTSRESLNIVTEMIRCLLNEISMPKDEFFNEYNQNRIRKAIVDIKAGKGVVHDLIEVDDE